MNRYGIPLNDLPAHCLDAVDAAERALARTLIVRDGHPLAAIVPMVDLDRIDPPDPAASGVDPLLAICGTCKHDEFVDSLAQDLDSTSLWHRPSGSNPGGRRPPPPPRSR
ncbi:MAG: hypothetical protein HOV80_20920 [Polyangiaceae bacterium]|nr:hypothetical protein [Polyangiaceae bacterium]